jgi:hypothetical protein
MREALLHAFPLAYDDDMIDEIKQQGDYPRIAYWHKNSFNINLIPTDGDAFAKKFRFMEDKDGNHIPQHRLDTILSHLANRFKIVKSDMPSLIVEGWCNVTKELANACYAELRRTFDEFTLCDNDWKANMFLTAWYPNVTRLRPKKGRRGKDVDMGDQDDVEFVEGTSAPGTKRTAISNAEIVPRKRAKMAESSVGMPMAIDPLCALFF